MAYVFVTQIPHRKVNGEWQPAINVAPASKFGTLRVILPNGPSIIDPTHAISKLKDELQDYSYDEGDHLLLTGDPAIIAIAGAVLGWIGEERFRLLKWEATERTYIPIDCKF